MYPFRCQLCTHRFLAFLWHYGHNPRREYERVPIQYQATLYPAGAQKPGEGTPGTILNLTVSGCLIETSAVIPQGTSLGLTIHVSDQFQPVQVEGAVVRSIKDKRMGLEFVKIAPEEETRLRVVIEANLLTRPR
jgi:c-di-GMP-binding flagellar brake protein YcgR